MTSPWQQGGYQQYPHGGHPGTPSGGFARPHPHHAQGGMPPYPPGNPYAAPQVPAREMAGIPRPATVEIAFWIATVVPILATVLIAVNLLFFRGMLSEATAGVDESMRSLVGTVAIGTMVFLMLIYVVLTALWIVFGFKLRRGANWARITLTVFAAIWLLSSISTMVSGGSGFVAEPVHQPTGAVVLVYVQGGMGLVAMAAFMTLVYLRPSNWYFQATRHL